MKKLFAALLVPLLAACLCSCGTESYEGTVFAMDTVITVSVYGKGAEDYVADALNTAARLDALLSVTDERSEVWALNNAEGATVSVSEDTAKLLLYATDYSKKTNGAFDITIKPLMSLWGFYDEPTVPEKEDIEALLPLVDYSKVVVNMSELTASVPSGAGVDFGGIAKGYLTDMIVKELRSQGVQSALISAGGAVHLLGSKPDGSDWRVAVRSPRAENERVGVLILSDAAVVTSGGYNRYFTDDEGVVYSHILDPKTGYPATGLQSVTIVAKSALLADAYSTALFVMGAEEAVDFWRSEGGFEMILVTDDGRLIVSSGLEFCFEFQYSCGYSLERVY